MKACITNLRGAGSATVIGGTDQDPLAVQEDVHGATQSEQGLTTTAVIGRGEAPDKVEMLR